jgi:DNA repair protein RecO (recombination protein O)
MPEPRNYQTEAIIIKKTKLGEADTILTMFTPALGKIQGFAKSLRKPKSKLAGHLELLTYSMVSLARGKNLDTITGSQTINSFMPVKNDLWLTSCALYVTELINQFTAELQENEQLFHLLRDTLERLCQANNKDLVIRYFEIRLLDYIGYRPQLRECVICHQNLEPTINSFNAPSGGMLCPVCAASHPFSYHASVNAQKVLRFLQSHDYAAASMLKIDSELAQELENILSTYLKHLLEKDVKSAVWMETMKEQRLKLNKKTLP